MQIIGGNQLHFWDKAGKLSLMLQFLASNAMNTLIITSNKHAYMA